MIAFSFARYLGKIPRTFRKIMLRAHKYGGHSSFLLENVAFSQFKMRWLTLRPDFCTNVTAE